MNQSFMNINNLIWVWYITWMLWKFINPNTIFQGFPFTIVDPYKLRNIFEYGLPK